MLAKSKVLDLDWNTLFRTNPKNLNRNKQKKVLVLLVAYVLAMLLWLLLLLPEALRIPDNYSYKADVFSVDNFYSEEDQRFTGEILSKTKFSYDVLKKKDGKLLVRNIFDVRKPSGEKIFTVERHYGIDPLTGAHVKGFGDKNRNGYLFAPRGLNKQNFTYWHINYDTPALMRFKAVETINGLKLHRYECKYHADQSENLKFLPGVPTVRGVELDINLDLWIEPVTGLMVKYEDYTTAWYYNRKTGKRICPWNKFHNIYNDISIAENLDKCKSEKDRVLLLSYGVTGFLTLLFVVGMLVVQIPVKQRFWKVYVPTFITLTVLLAISWVIYFVLTNQQRVKKELEFASGAKNIQENIVREAEHSSNVMFSLKGLLEGGTSINREQFARISRYYIQNLKSITALSWAPRISENNRLSFEKEIKPYGPLGIKEIGKNGKLHKAGSRPAYFPVLFIEPDTVNRAIIGYDLFSEKERRNALLYAESTGEIALTGALRLVQNQNIEASLMVLPVFSGSKSHKELLGFFTAIVKLDQLAASGLNYPGYSNNIKVELFFGETDSDRLLFSNAEGEQDATNLLYNKLQIGNRIFTVKFIATKDFFNDEEAKKNKLIFGVAVILAFSISFFVYWTLSSNRNELEVSNRSLRIAGNTLKGIINGTTDKVLAIDKNYKVLAYNDVLAAAVESEQGKRIEVGLKLNEILYDGLSEREKEEFYKCWRRGLKGEYFTLEQRVQIPQAGEQFLEITYYPIRESGGEVIGCSQITRDITGKKVAENFLSNRTRQMEDAQRIAHIGSWHLDLVTNRITGSEELYKILGIQAGEQFDTYEGILEVVHPDDKEAVNQLVQQTLIDFSSLAFYVRIVRPSAEVRILHCLGEVFIENGVAVQLSGTAQDVTEIKLIEAELKTAMELAEKSVVAKDRFLANMSHEIRTPMNALLGFSEILDTTTLDSTQREYLGVIKTSGENLLALINDILDYSKIEAGMMSIEETSFSLQELFHSVSMLFEQKAIEKKLPLVFNLDPKIPEKIIGDPLRLNQIMINLVGNAIKFTERGTVTVNAILSSETETESNVTIEVIDSGIGITPEQVAVIFERFNQASTETSRRYGGSGLGLSIVKGLLGLQGSEVFVESELGKGSKFWFTIAYKKNLSADNELKTDADLQITVPAQLGRLSILLAEDNKINQKLAKIILSGFGFDLDIGDNGRIAVEMFLAKKYDLILMDMQMPEMDGYEATKVIRETYRSAVPIVAMTANALEGEREKCLAIGMNDYISKPFNVAQLLKTIIRVMLPTETIS